MSFSHIKNLPSNSVSLRNPRAKHRRNLILYTLCLSDSESGFRRCFCFMVSNLGAQLMQLFGNSGGNKIYDFFRRYRHYYVHLKTEILLLARIISLSRSMLVCIVEVLERQIFDWYMFRLNLRTPFSFWMDHDCSLYKILLRLASVYTSCCVNGKIFLNMIVSSVFVHDCKNWMQCLVLVAISVSLFYVFYY